MQGRTVKKLHNYFKKPSEGNVPTAFSISIFMYHKTDCFCWGANPSYLFLSTSFFLYSLGVQPSNFENADTNPLVVVYPVFSPISLTDK